MKLIKVVINGQGGVGKDTFVSLCAKYGNVASVSMIDGIKEVAEMMEWGWTKTKKDRKFLSDLKDVAEEYNDFPFRHTFNQMAFLYLKEKDRGADHLVIFIHAREPKDIKRWVELGATTLLIRREEAEDTFGNHADDNVLDYHYDCEVYNDGTIDVLDATAKFFMEKILEERGQ